MRQPEGTRSGEYGGVIGDLSQTVPTDRFCSLGPFLIFQKTEI